MKVDDIIRMPGAMKRRFRLFGKIRRRRRARKAFSRDELLEYMRKGGFRSARVMMAKRLDGEPTEWDYRKEFGFWSKAVEAAFGKQILPTVDSMYLVVTALKFNIRTYEQYMVARKKDPIVFPSVRAVRREFGTFGNFFWCVRAKDFESTMKEYLKLSRRLNRRPTMDECHTAGVAVDQWMWLLETKEELYDMADRMAAIEARMRGGEKPR